jgi:hypothetical protein
MAQEPEVIRDELRDRAPARSGVTMGSEEARAHTDPVCVEQLPGLEVGVHEEALTRPNPRAEPTGTMGLHELSGACLQRSHGDTDVGIEPEDDIFKGCMDLCGSQGCRLAAVGVVKDDESVTTLKDNGSPRAGCGRRQIRATIGADANVEPDAVLVEKIGQEGW